MNKNEILNSFQAKRAKERRVWTILIICIVTFVIINVILQYFLFPVKQKSISMEPDIPVDSVIMTSPFSHNYKRGDVVLLDPLLEDNSSFFFNIGDVFTNFFTGQQISLQENNDVPGTKNKLRRVVGVPGDTIYMKDYVLFVKPWGEKHFLTEFELADEPYNVTFYVAPANWDDSLGTKGSFDEIVLADNQYFVLADNRKATDDSRLWGPVTDKQIASKALFCYFPFAKIRLF